jgi:hypothetical protein
MTLPDTPTRSDLIDRFAAVLPRVPEGLLIRPAMVDWHRGLSQNDVPLTPEYIRDAQANLEWIEDALKRMDNGN